MEFDLKTIVDVVQALGVTGLCVIAIYYMAKQKDKDENFIRKELMEMSKATVTAINNNTAALEGLPCAAAQSDGRGRASGS